jgi:YggT family protein
MIVAGAFLRAFLATLDIVFSVLQFLVFIWVILSWILFFTSQGSFRWKYRGLFATLTQLYEILGRALAPLLRPFRRLLPPWKTGGIDWSPLLLLLAIFFVRYLIRSLFIF